MNAKDAKPAIPVVERSMEEIEALIEQASRRVLTAEECALLLDLARTLQRVMAELQRERQTARQVLQKLFGLKTESRQNVIIKQTGASSEREADDAHEQDSSGSSNSAGTTTAPASPAAEIKVRPAKRAGHGRIPAEAYTGAPRVPVPHDKHSHGDPCPLCHRGQLYRLGEPERLVFIKGSALLTGTVYELERLRCSACTGIVKAEPPPEVGASKYDASAVATIAVARYGFGIPMHRLAKMQAAAGIPVPAGTQWDLVEEAAGALAPVFEELKALAAQAELLHNDDTSMRILDRMLELKRLSDAGTPASRTGTFTTGIVARLTDGREIALYLTGAQHAGENLNDLLAARDAGLAPPIQMCDGLNRNLPTDFETVLANCLTHARRHFVEIVESFPEDVAHVIDEVAKVYRFDADTKAAKYTDAERLAYHQTHSAPVLADLKTWMQAALDEKRVEPNSGLGGAIRYALKRWDELTLFLRSPGAPLDNGICERMLKRAVLHRKASLFYKTARGAEVGDLYMSVITTAHLAGVDPFHYLTEMLRHPRDVATAPAHWLPWTYQATLASLRAAASPH